MDGASQKTKEKWHTKDFNLEDSWGKEPDTLKLPTVGACFGIHPICASRISRQPRGFRLRGVQRMLIVMYSYIMSKQSVHVWPTKGTHMHVLWVMSPNSGLAQELFSYRLKPEIYMQIFCKAIESVLSQIHPSASSSSLPTTHACASLWSATRARIACSLL